jgi:TolA-binding protein
LPRQSNTVSNLFEPALYQEVIAGEASGDLAAAENALTRILAWYPEGFHTERAVLLMGQAFSRAGDPHRARSLFTGYINVASNATRLPDIQLAIARTYEKENDWTNAIQQYDRWLSTFSNHVARPQAEYYRAWATAQTGDRTNAFSAFTNLISRFPTNDLAALAQWWVADYFFGMGAFSSAEDGYEKIVLQWPGSELAAQAQMMAGRSASARYSYKDARKYFADLYNNTNCPLDLRVQALFALGDTSPSEKSGSYEEAINAFRIIARDYSTNKLAVLALGQKACYTLQWAQTNSQYEAARDAFFEVITNAQADARATNIATIGLGVVLEKMAQQRPEQARDLRQQALDKYVSVFLNEEQIEMFWIKYAGMEAGRLASEMQEWQKAMKIYRRLQQMLPAPLPSLQNRIQDCERNLARLSKG